MTSNTMSIDVIRCEQALAMAGATQSRWLHPLELARWQRLRSPLRRRHWLAGRWWLKHLLLKRWNLGIAPRDLLIVSHDAQNLGIAPQAYAAGKRLSMALSLSHCDGYVAVAIDAGQPGSCGIDVIDTTTTNLNALKAWITDEEVPGGRDNNASQLPIAWAAKEAAFKTLVGEPFRPARIVLRPATASPWQWMYRRADTVITGEVELQQHSRFVLAIAHRHVPC